MIRRPPRSTLSLHDALPISKKSNISCLMMTAMVPSVPPRDNEPTSPMKTSAGCALYRSEEHTSELQSQSNLVCRLLLEKKKGPHISWPLPPQTTDISVRTMP